MTITIAGYTDAKSATVSSRGVLNSYFYDPNLSTFTTLLSGTNAQSFLSTENWITSGGIPTATQNPQNSSYWTLGPAGTYPFEGKAKGRYGLTWTASADLVSPLGVDALNFTSQNYNITYGFDPTLTMTAGYGTGTIITVASTVNLQPGYIVSVSSGTGTFSANTYVTGVLNLTQFTVNTAPSVALSNASVLASATGTLTGTSSSSSTTITVTSGTTTGMVVGSVVYTKSASTTGYFTAGTYVTAVNSSTQFTVNTAPAVALSGATIGFNNALIGWQSSTANSATAATAFASAQQMGFGTYLTGATSTTTTVTVTSTANVYPGMYMVIRTGTGTIAAGTIVTGIAGPTTFTINNTPSVALSAATISLMYFPYAGAATNYRFLAVDSNVMTSATAQGPLTGSSGSTSGWLVSYYDVASAVNWLFGPELPMYASPFQANYSKDANNFMLYGRTNTSANVSVSAALNIPAWVTSPTYSIATITASAGASGTTITVQSIPPGLQIGAPVSVSSGTGVFAAGTTITAINSSTTFTVSAAPTTPLVTSDIILLANNTANNGLPPGLSLNTSTGALTGTLDISSMPAGLNTFQFSLRCDFTFGSTGSATYNSGTGALGLTGSNTANMYYEVYDYSSSLQSVSLTNHNVAYGDRISPNTDPHRTSVIVIG
jgi:hypothetical protein